MFKVLLTSKSAFLSKALQSQTRPKCGKDCSIKTQAYSFARHYMFLFTGISLHKTYLVYSPYSYFVCLVGLLRNRCEPIYYGTHSPLKSEQVLIKPS